MKRQETIRATLKCLIRSKILTEVWVGQETLIRDAWVIDKRIHILFAA